jgi:very-short-patch-repair endonuclease
MYRDKKQRDFARALRNALTSAEKHLWHFLRAQQLGGHKFRRQAAIGPYVVDFVCFPLKLIVELDGPQHLETNALEYDARRTACLASRGFRVIRFRNQELDENSRTLIAEIELAISDLQASSQNPPSPTLPTEGREPE